MKKISILCGVAGLLPAIGWAHPGHGGHDDGYTIIHYFTTMPHALVMWSVVILGALYLRYLYLREKREDALKKQTGHARAVDRHGDH